MVNQLTSIINLEKFINSFKNNIPDTLEYDLLKLLSRVGFSQEYNIDLFTSEVDLNEINSVELLHFWLQAKTKLELVAFMKENISLLLTHENLEVRGFSESFLKLIPHKENETVSVRIDDIEAAHQIRHNTLEKAFNDSINVLKKVDDSCCLERTALTSFKIKKGTAVTFKSKVFTFDNDAVIELNKPKAGTDYLVYVTSTGKVTTETNYKGKGTLLGGFHFAPGGCADDNRTGGDDVPQINQYSVWDLQWRPTAKDPRGMTLVNGKFWSDIYLMTEDGDSTYGKNVRTNINWWEVNEKLNQQGKRCPVQSEFQELAFGTTEHKSSGNKIDKNSCAKEFTSKCGAQMSTGCYYVWGNIDM